jgi:hypothetical protein
MFGLMRARSRLKPEREEHASPDICHRVSSTRPHHKDTLTSPQPSVVLNTWDQFPNQDCEPTDPNPYPSPRGLFYSPLKIGTFKAKLDYSKWSGVKSVRHSYSYRSYNIPFTRFLRFCPYNTLVRRSLKFSRVGM